MSNDRSRPWQNPTALVGFQPIWAGQFDTFSDWVNHASRALTGEVDSNGAKLAAFCVDALGRRCHNGRDFMRARDEDAFPVRYFFDGTVAQGKVPKRLTLTAREAEVMQNVENGLTNKNIAARLRISVRTVETHRLNARKKLAAQAEGGAA